MSNSDDFISRVEHLMAMQHFTKAEIAQKIGIKATNFQSWEKGSMPSCQTAYLLAKELHTTVEYLVSGSDINYIPPDILALAKQILELPKVYQNFMKVDLYKYQSAVEQEQKANLS